MALTLTQNLSLTFAGSENTRIDFMFHVIEGSSLERTTKLLKDSWNDSPLDTLKLLFYTRDIRRGKGCRAQFLLCLKWIYNEQFESLLNVLQFIPEYGSYKDLFNTLLIALFDDLPHDADESQEAKKPAALVSKFDRIILKNLPKEERRKLNETISNVREVRRKEIVFDPQTGRKVAVRTSMKNERIVAEIEKTENKKLTKAQLRELLMDKLETCSKVRRGKVIKPSPFENGFFKFKTDKRKLKLLNDYRKNFAKEKLENDEKFKRLYDAVVEMIVVQLKEDYQACKASKNLSLLPKWIPNRQRQFDKYLNIQLPIAKQLFSSLDDFRSEDKNDKQIIFEFEKLIAKLRRKIQIPEMDMSEGRWNEVVYDRITSKAMFRYKSSFARMDFERFEKFLTSAKTVKGAALTPAEIIREVIRTVGVDDIFNFAFNDNFELKPENQLEVATLDKQWLSLVEDLKKKKTLLLEETLAICDVSGSMCFTRQAIQPIFGAVGLTLLLMHFTTAIWARKCIAFSEEPKMFTIDITKSILDQVREIMRIDAGLSTNLNATFDLILSQAKEAKLPQEKMPRVLFIFSDMEFDIASSGFTNFEAAKMQFHSAGYNLPLVVFWNLNGDKEQRSTPVKCNENGVVLLSGYSAQTLNFFMCEDFEQVSPLANLQRILEDKRYNCFEKCIV